MIDKDHISARALMLVTREPTISREVFSKNQSPTMRAVNEFLSVAIRTVLEAYDWSFASKRQSIFPSTIYTADEDKVNEDPNLYSDQYLGWLYQYKLPGDFLGHLSIYNKQWTGILENREDGIYTPLWWLQGKTLCSNIPHETLNIEYVCYDSEEIIIPAEVELCMIYYLAHLIAPILIGSNAASEQWLRLYNMALMSARSSDTHKHARIRIDNYSGDVINNHGWY